jgi:hypothetical protein
LVADVDDLDGDAIARRKLDLTRLTVDGARSCHSGQAQHPGR